MHIAEFLGNLLRDILVGWSPFPREILKDKKGLGRRWDIAVLLVERNAQYDQLEVSLPLVFFGFPYRWEADTTVLVTQVS